MRRKLVLVPLFRFQKRGQMYEYNAFFFFKMKDAEPEEVERDFFSYLDERFSYKVLSKNVKENEGFIELTYCVLLQVRDSSSIRRINVNDIRSEGIMSSCFSCPALSKE